VTDTAINPPSPVVLEATVESNFICKDKPLLYSFSCTLYGYDLVWYFDDEIVTAFLPNDTFGNSLIRVFQYPPSAPVYNITAALTQVSTATVSRYHVPFCVSVLTVQPFNESDIQVLPFTVSCQTHCEGATNTAICQTKHYDVAGMLNNIYTATVVNSNVISQCHCSDVLHICMLVCIKAPIMS
jgi:hypothetical protein